MKKIIESNEAQINTKRKLQEDNQEDTTNESTKRLKDNETNTVTISNVTNINAEHPPPLSNIFNPTKGNTPSPSLSPVFSMNNNTSPVLSSQLTSSIISSLSQMAPSQLPYLQPFLPTTITNTTSSNTPSTNGSINHNLFGVRYIPDIAGNHNPGIASSSSSNINNNNTSNTSQTTSISVNIKKEKDTSPLPKIVDDDLIIEKQVDPPTKHPVNKGLFVR